MQSFFSQLKLSLENKVAPISNELDSNPPSHAVTRISREIWQYSIGGYSEDQLEAYLE